MIRNLSDFAKELSEEYSKSYSHIDIKIPQKAKDAYSDLLSKYKSLGYADVKFLKYTFEVETTTGKKISIPNFWFYAAAFFVPYLEELKKYKLIYEKVTSQYSLPKDWAVNVKKGGDFPVSSEQLIDLDLSSEEAEFFKTFTTSYEWWGGGKTVDRGDYFISPIVKLGNFLAESQSAIAEICLQLSELDDPSIVTDLNSYFKNKTNETSKSGSHDATLKTSISKPFLLLAGISGTGKTRFVREQAKATGSLAETYCLTPVRPDWHEPSDLLGYTSRLNGKAEYITTDVLQFIAKAWRAKVDAGLSLAVGDVESNGECLVASGDTTQLENVLPYWLCLDEMNLAPVEQYFSDYLSILETREWQWDGDEFSYFSDPLLKASTIQQLDIPEQESLRKELGFTGDDYNQLWVLICKHGMGIPFNLIVAGTVNMDETTHGFSRKVIDRALSFDFGEFFPNDYAEFFKPTIGNKTLSYPVLSAANHSQDQLPSIDSDGQKSINFLNTVNTVLNNTPFKLAYRALNELLLAVISAAPEGHDTLHLQAIWDDFLMCKVLPRIEGDSDKLMTDDNQLSLLQKLSVCLTTQLAEVWDAAEGADTARPDLYREKVGAESEAKVLRITCRSKAKLEWMQKRLERSGFTSFWP